MTESFAGKTIAIAGGSKGIGLAIAQRFSALGARVVIGARSPAPEVSALPNAEFVACNMNEPEGPQALIDKAAEGGAKIHVLINSVGGGIIRPDPANVTDEQWMEMFYRSFFYVVRTCRAALPHMVDGESSILNISSISAQRAEPVTIDYSAVKAALDSYSKTLSLTLAPRGIRVNVLAPGATETPLWTDKGGLTDQAAEAFGVSPEETLTSFLTQIPLGRMAQPDEMAGLAVFLSSPDASYITGSNMRVDGGWLGAIR